jgi:hypothetical protein
VIAGASPFRTLSLDRGSERSVAALRLTAAALVVCGSIWLLSIRPPLAAWACAGGGIVASLAWLVMGLRARRRIRDADRHRLVLEPEALHLVEGDRERRIAWADVTQVELAEDRLVVRVSVTDGEALSIEPRFGGLGAHDLEAAVRRARDEAMLERPGPLQRAPT